MKRFPRQDVKESTKDAKWFAEHLDFGEDLLRNNDQIRSKMDRLYASYNGVVSPDSTKYLTDTYGRKNRGKYIDYRIGRNKLDILHGEWLKTPLKTTVKTINSAAQVKKLEQYQLLLGAAYMKPDLEKLRGMGVDPLEGMEIPDKDDPNLEEKITPKDQNEIVMSRIVEACVEEMDLVRVFGECFRDATITSRAGSQIMVDEESGDVWLESIDPRDRICFEYDRDPLMKKGFLFGRRRIMTIEEVLTKYPLNEVQRAKLEAARDNPEVTLQDQESKNRFTMKNGHFCVEVIHIEWAGVKPKYTKISPKTKSQLEFTDPNNKAIELPIHGPSYEEKEADYKKRGDEVKVEWERQIYEATRIGTDIDIFMRPKPLLARDNDSGKPFFSYTYVTTNLVDGDAVSVQEVVENFSNIHNVVMYQALKEINKIKGKVLAYDRSGLPKGSTVKEVLYKMLNDSFIDYNSAGQGNMGGRDLPIERVLREIDLGLSNSFRELINFKNDNLMMMDRVTGINENREGQIAASSTASNAMSSIEASRTITEGLFFYMNEYVEQVLTKLTETAKVVWGLHKPDKLRYLLGDKDFQFLMGNDQSLADDSYRCYLTNGRREEMIRRKLEVYAESYANKGEIPLHDLISFQMADSLAAAKNAVEAGWNRVQQMRMMEQNKQLMAQQEQGSMQSEAMMQMAKEDREDKQAAKKEEIVLKGKMDIEKEMVKQKGQMFLDQNKFDNEQNEEPLA